MTHNYRTQAVVTEDAASKPKPWAPRWFEYVWITSCVACVIFAGVATVFAETVITRVIYSGSTVAWTIVSVLNLRTIRNMRRTEKLLQKTEESLM